VYSNLRGRGRFQGASFRGPSWQFFQGKGRHYETPEVSKVALDNELDDYMAKTQSRLNADLDQYMAVDN